MDIKQILIGLNCAHMRMRECHKGCGHYYCPKCGLTWDEAAEGDPDYSGSSSNGKTLRSQRRDSGSIPDGSTKHS